MLLSLIKKEAAGRRWYFATALAVFGLTALVAPISYRMMFSLLLITQQHFGFSEYIWSSWWGQGAWQMGYVFAVVLGTSVRGYEADKGIMEFLLTRNISRQRVLSVKYLVDILCMSLIMSVSTLVLYITALTSGVEYGSIYSMGTATLFLWLAILLPYSLCAFTTIATDSKWKALLVGGVWVILELVLYYGLNTPLSFTYHVTNQPAFAIGRFPVVPAVFLLIGSTSLLLTSIQVFKTQDIFY